MKRKTYKTEIKIIAIFFVFAITMSGCRKEECYNKYPSEKTNSINRRTGDTEEQKTRRPVVADTLTIV